MIAYESKNQFFLIYSWMRTASKKGKDPPTPFRTG